ncbi:MAG: T9SS type A sorting domain-containing protein [Bacteroidota bacterium]
MMKKLFTILALISLFVSTMNAQWTDLGAFPDTNYTGSTHGIAVDAEGKIWTAPYYYEVSWIDGEDTLLTSGIRVFSADGVEAAFSPIHTVVTGGGFTVDTLYPGRCRGLATDENGDIVYVASGPSKMYKINHQTGEGMFAVEIPETGSSPTGPGIADDGTIFVGPVVGNGSADAHIAMYDTDGAYFGNAVDGPPDIARCLEVSPDGNTIYWTAFTGAQRLWIYNRPDEFSSYALVDTVLDGMSIETARLNPETGLLWVSNDARGLGYTSPTWFAFDPTTKTLVDSFHYVGKDPEAADYFPRGLDFSPDGKTAYVGTFSAKQYVITKFYNGTVDVEELGTGVPEVYSLSQNYPNPFNPTTEINFSIPESGLVTLKIYNVLGQEVAELVNDVKSAGSYQVTFDASDLTSGMYVYTITAGNYTAVKKMMLLK